MALEVGWDENMMEMIQMKIRADPLNGSGRLVNPGKHYFLKLASTEGRTFVIQQVKDCVLYILMALVSCGMELNI